MANVNIKIITFKGAVATSGVHMGGDRSLRRRLEPGEVVAIPDDLKLPDGRALVDVLLDTETVEVTRKEETRPLDFPDALTAKFTSPGRVARSLDDERAMETAEATVRKGLGVKAAAPIEPEPEAAESVRETAPPQIRTRRRGNKSEAANEEDTA